ncbi:MAG: PLP-dependent aminotransferase family protein [Clostridiales bacterium]|nr:PLP-dependent aminotransferase family protein [Eubacteriales bacterium]MDH7567807.1 PLP-dependent aminotransferase family protein [Clostridiales bacterium]
MLELFKSIRLDKEDKIPLYTQLYGKIKEMINEGILCADFRLPSVRRLADALHVNRVTVVSAYRQLESEGLVYSKPGSGTYVENAPALTGRSAGKDPDVFLDELYQQDDLSLISNGQIKIDDKTINFASATPTPDLFPVEDFKLVLNEVLERDKGNAFGYQDSQGFYPIRESIYKVLENKIQGVSPESIQVISGAQQGIDIISKALLKQGDCVITESPTYTGAIAVFKSRGAEIIDVEMQESGPDLNILEYSLKQYRPRLIYTIPSFQNPTGYSYSNYKRAQLLNLAEKYNCHIIEDDYVSDLDFEGKNYTPLKAMDKQDRVIFIKSFSKIFMPGLRLGFMVAPRHLQGIILEAKHATDISTSGLIQRAFDLYIRKGFWDRHFKFMYDIYRERYTLAVKSLDRNLPDSATYAKPGGGLNIWLKLPMGISANSLSKHAQAEGIVFAPGKIFYSRNTPQKLDNIRLSFAAADSGQIEKGMEKLCRMIHLFQQRQVSYQNLPVL